MFNLFRKKIVPEVLTAYKWRLPDVLDVSVKVSKDGGYVASVRNLRGCVTQAETGKELFEMVNDAVYAYLEVPDEYKVYMPSFFPPEEVRQALGIKGIKIPARFLEKDFILQRT